MGFFYFFQPFGWRTLEVDLPMFKEVSTTLDFIQQEEDVLSFWHENQIFEKSIHQQEGKPPFIFLEGPPFANAPPGVHHVLARIMKDAVCRYKTMTGHQVQRKAGWDTHGLPVEYQVEKQLNIRNKQDLEAYGVGKFIQKCKENVFQYEQDWRRMTERIGFWVNLDDPYITLSNDYIVRISELGDLQTLVGTETGVGKRSTSARA